MQDRFYWSSAKEGELNADEKKYLDIIKTWTSDRITNINRPNGIQMLVG